MRFHWGAGVGAVLSPAGKCLHKLKHEPSEASLPIMSLVEESDVSQMVACLLAS